MLERPAVSDNDNGRSLGIIGGGTMQRGRTRLATGFLIYERQHDQYIACKEALAHTKFLQDAR